MNKCMVLTVIMKTTQKRVSIRVHNKSSAVEDESHEILNALLCLVEWTYN
jgi:hypothetical protein